MTFPCILKRKDKIKNTNEYFVLFFSPSRGVVVKADSYSNHKFGEFLSNWNIGYFVHPSGPVTIELTNMTGTFNYPCPLS